MTNADSRPEDVDGRDKPGHDGEIVVLLDDHQRLAELDRLAVLDQNLDHRARARRRNLVHGLHRLDDEQRIAGAHVAADLDEGPRARARAPR